MACGSDVKFSKRANMRMRSYMTYLLLIFAVYLSLVVIFHRELQGSTSKISPLSDESYSDKVDAVNKIEKRNLNMIVNEMKFETKKAVHLKVLKSYRVIVNKKPAVVTSNIRVTSLGMETSAGYHDDEDPLHFQKPFHNSCMDKNKGFIVPNIHRLKDAYLYSAFYDDRRSTHYIRMMALLRKTSQPKLECVFPGGITRPVEYYQMCENHNRPYGGWFASCRVPENISGSVIPCQIQVNEIPKSKPKDGTMDYSTIMPIQASNSLSRTPRKTFGICVPPLFGYINPKILVRFIELNLILGANHIVFYTMPSVQKELLAVLQHYEEKGVVTSIKWKLPVSASLLWYNGQLITINDCLYRNMYNFKYLAFHDIDEILVPRRYGNWSQMVDQLPFQHNNTPVAGYMFSSAFFNIDKRRKQKRSKDLEHFVSETQRTLIYSRIRTKPFVEPRRIFELGIHHISRPLEDFLQPFRVNPDHVLLHHYRKCTAEFDPRMRCKAQVEDNWLARHSAELARRYQIMWSEMYNASSQDV